MNSQDFSLRISDSFSVDDTHENITAKQSVTKHNNTVIIISDSNSESSPESIGKRKLEPTSWRSRKNCRKNQTSTFTKYHSIYSDTDRESNTERESDELIFIARSEQNGKYDSIPSSSENIKTTESSSSDGILSDVDKNNREKRVLKRSGHVYNNTIRQLTGCGPEKSPSLQTVRNHHANYTSSSSSTCSSNNNCAYTVGSSSKKPNSLKNKLTKEDANKIFKNIKATKLVYESPVRRKEEEVIINESDDDDIHPAVENDKYIKAKINTGIRIINETVSDNDDNNDIIPNSAGSTPKVMKTTVNQVLNTAQENTNVLLSERKKQEISRWIMTNSPDFKSDSSLSHITESNRNSISSGNSSLERLEMNYETPNNRHQIFKSNTAEKTIRTQKGNQNLCNSALKQSTLHKFLQNTVQKVPEVTPDRTIRNLGTPSVNTPTNPSIINCANILDTLYGNEWRHKADSIFPQTEAKKQNVTTKDRAVQTERKKVGKKIHYSSDSEDECFNNFVKNITSNLNPTKKQHPIRRNARDSFINDGTSSETDSDSMYHSALTNPQNRRLPKAKPVSTVARRIIQICDSDTDDELPKENNKLTKKTSQRRLSFSDDERGSITSEFDPGDVIPPKVVPRTNKAADRECRTTPCNIYQTPVGNRKPTANTQRIRKEKSFLASLSDSVPLSEIHPDAKKYRVDYKNTKEELCKKLFKLYNEKIFDKKLPADMSIEWNVRMRGTAGFCYNKRSLKTLSGITRSSRIVLATKILDTPDRLRDTLVHEMCHAAAWLINDVSDGHGPYWNGWASKAMRTFPELPPIKRCHDYTIKTKFTYKCTGCGYSIGRHSKSLDTERKRCGHCYGKFELLINKTTKTGTVQMQTPQREASGFALFVKENYNSVKKDRNVKHAEVMKILGQQFSAIKIAKKQTNVENETDSPCVQ